MSTNSNKLPPSADVLMEFVLQIDERFVGSFREFDTP